MFHQAAASPQQLSAGDYSLMDPPIRQSVRELQSKLSFKCAKAPYDFREKEVKKFLHQ